MADFSTSRQDRRHRLAAGGSWHRQGLLQSPPLTLSELGRSYEELHRGRRSPLRFQDSLPEDRECLDPICPCRSLKGLGSVDPLPDKALRLARRLHYDPSDAASPSLSNGTVDLGPYNWITTRRRYSLSHLPDDYKADDPLCPPPQVLGLGHFDVNLKACLSDSGKKRAQLVDCLKEAHSLLEGQSAQLRKREDQLLESKAKIELLSVRLKQLENSISQLEREKNMLEMSRLEDQKKSGALQDKVSHLEAEMAKAKSSLDLINRSHGSNPSHPPLSFTWTKLEDGALKQERDVLSSKSVRLEETVTNLRTQLASAAANKDRFLQEKLDLHQQVQHLTLELERALRGREGFDDQVADLHMELASTKSQANRQDQEKVLLKENLAAIKQVNEKLTSELSESRRRLELCQDQLHQLQAEKVIFSNQIEALEMERGQLVSEKEILLTAVQTGGKTQEDELLTLRQNCKELRVKLVLEASEMS
ncbi:sodium channel and clathrin linker 1 [Carcharodon carcharias]|uniref:sodium channel and clathrin linker 1 n=1 Tax=Carcharodon carcharias TaxID=13397 RepID=UPI001B7ED2FE|nr:sodium channel and clathrin linker 1 [Carcharodon carcharias]